MRKIFFLVTAISLLTKPCYSEPYKPTYAEQEFKKLITDKIKTTKERAKNSPSYLDDVYAEGFVDALEYVNCVIYNMEVKRDTPM